MGPVNIISAHGINTFNNSDWAKILPSPHVYKPPAIAKKPVRINNMPKVLFNNFNFIQFQNVLGRVTF